MKWKTWLGGVALAAIMTAPVYAASAQVDKAEKPQQWQYRVFYTMEVDGRTKCLKANTDVCFGGNVEDRITLISDLGWEIMSIQRAFDPNGYRAFYYIAARRPKP